MGNSYRSIYGAVTKTKKLLEEDLRWPPHTVQRELEYLLRYACDRDAFEVLEECIPQIIDALVRFGTPMAVSLTQHIDYRDKTCGVPQSAETVSTEEDCLKARSDDLLLKFFATGTITDEDREEYLSLSAELRKKNQH